MPSPSKQLKQSNRTRWFYHRKPKVEKIITPKNENDIFIRGAENLVKIEDFSEVDLDEPLFEGCSFKLPTSWGQLW